MPNNEIQSIIQRLVEALSPLKIYLFGSYAYGIPQADSDYDLFIIIDDVHKDLYSQTVRAYQAIRHAHLHPVDIIIQNSSAYEAKKDEPQNIIENEVYKKGKLLYDATCPSISQ